MNARAGFGSAIGSAVSAAAPASIPRRPAFAGSPVFPILPPAPSILQPNGRSRRPRDPTSKRPARSLRATPGATARSLRARATIGRSSSPGARGRRLEGGAGPRVESDATWRDWGRESWRRCWRASPPRRRGAAVGGARRRRCGRGVTVWSRHRDRGARRPGSRAGLSDRATFGRLLSAERFEPIGDGASRDFEQAVTAAQQVRFGARPGRSLGGGMSPDGDGESAAPGRDAHLYATDAALFSHR